MLKHFFAVGAFLISSFLLLRAGITIKNDCQCNKKETEKKIKEKNFNSLPRLDTCKKLARLSYADNRLLWYRDIENPDTTKFTRQWSDFIPNNYHASHPDFINYYKGRKNIELAFLFGPTGDMWGYHAFILKKVDCCYLLTRSYFSNARFTYKAYAVLGKSTADSLFRVAGKQVKVAGDKLDKNFYCADFVDNRNKQIYYVDLSIEHDDVVRLFNFVDEKIKWTRVFGK